MDPAQRRQQDWKIMHQYSVLHAIDEEIECFFLVLPMLFYPPLVRFPNPLASLQLGNLTNPPYTTITRARMLNRAANLILFENILHLTSHKKCS